MIDTHCHLSYPDFAGDLDEVLARAATAGVTSFITVATDRDDWRRCLDLAATRPAVRVALGLHPNEASHFTPALADELRAAAASNSKVVAIGETGLDWYREQCPREKQYESFRAHLRISSELKKPFVLHCREAEEEMFAELAAFQQQTGAPLRGVWHCFTSTAAWAASSHIRRRTACARLWPAFRQTDCCWRPIARSCRRKAGAANATSHPI
jgi:TatD DNase family protein